MVTNSPLPKALERDKAALILIVDDDEENRAILTMVLEDEGYTVATARNGAEALAMLVTPPACDCGLILLDLMMPVMDGAGFRAAQRQDPRIAAIPVILVTATNAVAERARDIGVTDFLAKPPELKELLQKVKTHVRS